MYKVCHTEQSSARQRMIENALLQLMLKQRYEDISVRDLCDTARIPRKTFYRYFSSKDGTLYALVDHTLDGLFARPPEAGKKSGTIADELERTFDYWKKNKTLLDALAHSFLSGILVERANSFALREGHMPRQFKRYEPQVRDLALSFFYQRGRVHGPAVASAGIPPYAERTDGPVIDVAVCAFGGSSITRVCERAAFTAARSYAQFNFDTAPASR